MAQTLFSLDAPQPLSTRAKTWQAIAVVTYVVLVAVAWFFAPVQWRQLPAVGLAHALIGAFISAVTALLMFSHARATGRRGYLVIGVTFLYLAGLLLAFPLFFPGAVVAREQLVGTPQSAPGLYFAWHLAFPVGLSVAAWILYADQIAHRRPGLKRSTLWWSVIAAVGAVIVTVLVAGPLSSAMPEVVLTDAHKNSLGQFMDVLILVLSAVFAAVAFYCARTGSVIGRWLAGMSMLALGEAIVNLHTGDRFTAGWYLSRLLWLLAVGTLLVALIWNLARVDRANAELATSDSLTGADSRLAFLASVQREIARTRASGRPIAMLWIDLDGFKGINDQFGHRSGDEVLRQVSQRLCTHVRIGDHVGRLGGDEFGVLLCDYGDADAVHRVAERLLDSVREPVLFGDTAMHVSAAIGIATAPGDATSADDLLLCADLAMYAAKESGGDLCEVFTPAIGTEAVARAQLRQDLAEALRAGDFRTYYQPIYEADGLRLAAVEMLVRWEHDGEILPAGSFVGFAETTGQIVSIGRLLLRQLEQDMPRWLAAFDEDFFVTVNLSVKELADRGMVDDLVTGALSQYAHRIMVEVTESLELQKSPEAAHNLERIRDAGLRIAIDDFGAGFSNFTRLEELRPSLLKVDRALVRRAGSEVDGGIAFLTAATSVAASLNCDVVAEGVETAAEAQVVTLMGVRYVQGFRYARPAPIETWLEATVREG